MQMCLINMVLLFGFYILLYYNCHAVKMKFGGVDYRLLIPIAFPSIALIMSYLAYRGIQRDENLVRSLNRIR